MKKPGRPAGAYAGFMAISIKHVPLPVLDIEAALSFYRDGLGLEVLLDVPNGEMRWVTLGADGQTALVLSTPGSGRGEAEARELAGLIAKGSLGPYVFAADDLQAVFDKLAAAGFEALQEPADQPWGPRDCAFRDPSGNLVRINQA